MEQAQSLDPVRPGPLRFALVGCGGIASRHAEVISSSPNTQLVATADKDPARGKAFADRFAVSWYQDVGEMLDNEDIDFVVVLTPSGTHAEIAIASIRRGKHVLIEKPLALRADNARRIVEEAREAGVKAFVVHQNRYNPPIQKLMHAIQTGRLGRIVMASARVRWCRPQRYYDQASWRGTWRFDGGVFANQAVHHIDLLTWLGGGLESVYAKGTRAMAEIEAEDLGIAVLRFKSGAIGSIEATTCARPHDIESSISILGERGTVEIAGTQLDRVQVWAIEGKEEGDQEFLDAFSKSPNEFSKKGHWGIYDALVTCMKTGNPGCLPTVEDGLMSIEALEAIYESMFSGREVVVGRVSSESQLGQRSKHAGDVQNLSQRQDRSWSPDPGLLSDRRTA